jgi:hypothetical protein
VFVFFQGRVRPDEERIVAPDGAEEVGPQPSDPRPDLPVVVSGGALHPQVHPAPDALHDPEELTVRSLRAAPTDGEAVDQSNLIASLLERGLQDQRVVEVATMNVGSPGDGTD